MSGETGNSLRDSLVHLEGVERVFHTETGVVNALEDISVSFRAGEFVCITGPEGSGKTTLLHILGCLDQPTGGKYRFAARDVSRLDDAALAWLRRQAIGFVFQGYGLLDAITAQGNVELPGAYAGLGEAERAQQARRLLRSVGLGHRLRHFPGQLSGGEQQRVAIARGLMNGCRIILADEPTGALDSRRRKEVLEVFRELASRGCVVVVVSHDSAAATAAGRRIELKEGRVVRDSGTDPGVSKMASGTAATAGTGRRKFISAAHVLRLALQALGAARLRAALLVGATALGVASAIAMLGLANGSHQASLEVMGSLGADRLGLSQLPEPGVPAAGAEDAGRIAELGNVREVVLMQSGARPVQYQEKLVAEAEVYGTQDVPEFMWMQWPIERGDYITRKDGEERAQVAVIGPQLRDLLFDPDADPLGKWVDAGGVSLRIKGVLAPHPIMQNEAHRTRTFPPVLWVPFSIGNDLLFGSETGISISVYVKDLARLEDTAREIRDLMIRRLGHGNFLVNMDAEIVGPYRAFVELRVRLLIGIAAASIGACALVVMALTLIAVRQRKREIAIRMAVGARRQDILRQFLAESGLVTLGGVVLGLSIGWLPGFLAEVFGAQTAYQAWFIWAAAGAALVSGLASGVLPAYRASRLDPAAALAAE